MSSNPTPWKKSRTFGDIYGGRRWRKFSDNIFARAHSIQRPSPHDDLPILIEDNPSRDFYFPLSGQETLTALKSLPKRDYTGITHVWLRKVKKADFIDGKYPYATFISGSGVELITLYAWPKSNVILHGRTRPANKVINEIERAGAIIEKQATNWISKWTQDSARKFFIDSIFHEVGHHVDGYRRYFSKANKKELEEFAEQYAFAKNATATYVFNHLKNQADNI